MPTGVCPGNTWVVLPWPPHIEVGSQECVCLRSHHNVRHAMVNGTTHPTVGSYFSSANKCALGTDTKPPNPLPPPQMLFWCSSFSQCHKYDCVIVPVSLYIETEITRWGLVSENKTTWPQTRQSQREKRGGKSNRVGLRRNKTDKWRWSLWVAMTCALWWYNEDSEDEGREKNTFWWHALQAAKAD